MLRIGFLVNPVAGLGGTVGLKGSDGVSSQALELGAVPRSGDRALLMLNRLKRTDILFLTCAGPMGENVLKSAGAPQVQVIYRPGAVTTAMDTKEACRRFQSERADLIVFCGGDGTARDVFDIVGTQVPILGLPAGVKMYSAVFAIDPIAAASVLDDLESAGRRDAEILDVDEESYRSGTLATRLYGVARVPVLGGMIQAAKYVVEEQDEERAKDEIAEFITKVMLPDTIYIIGAGSTTERIAHRLGVQKTLLGVDVLMNGRLLAPDADEKTLLSFLEGSAPARIIVSPIGAQGFIFGRGTQQISANVIRRVGLGNIIVVATPAKCRATPLLHVDTGDPALDKEFPDSLQVISGYSIAQRKKIGKYRSGS